MSCAAKKKGKAAVAAGCARAAVSPKSESIATVSVAHGSAACECNDCTRTLRANTVVAIKRYSRVSSCV